MADDRQLFAALHLSLFELIHFNVAQLIRKETLIGKTTLNRIIAVTKYEDIIDHRRYTQLKQL